MKPETATALTVSLLLVGSALCVGARYTIDRQDTGISSPKDQAATLPKAPEDSRNTKAGRSATKPSDPQVLEQRLRAIFATSNEADGARAVLDLVAAFKGDDWALALDTMKKIGASSGSAWYLLIISAWTESDPQAAMAWATANKMESYVLPAWLHKDPDAAIAFLKSKDDLGSTPRVLGFARAMEALAGDLPRIREILMAVPERSGRMLVEQAHPRFSKIPADTFYAWADSFEGVRREQVMHLVLTNLEGADAKLAFARRFPDDIGPRNYGPIYQDWFKADEAAALKAFEDMEPGPMHEAALYAIANGLYMKGRLAEALALTRRWPEKISNGFLSDLLLGGDAKDSPLILAEIPRLQDGPLKVNRYQCALALWFQADPAAARKWLAENEVPEQVRKEFEGK
ncbi:hypothetical protein [Haloferula sp. BvORR071]|uniref:hypothetical protein n=1 Tax=Haloferula sp. BvORR071 TaxID=1396141 RepID=UPI00054E2314|nr:hypothetical protein [Haloferula sp. BvORR071]